MGDSCASGVKAAGGSGQGAIPPLTGAQEKILWNWRKMLASVYVGVIVYGKS